MSLVVTPSQPVSGVQLHTYDNLDTADTSPQSILLSGTAALAGAIQVIGTFGSSSITVQGSNDGTNWVTLADRAGTAIAITAAGGAEFSTSFVYIRPLSTGGSGDDVDVFISLRG